MNFNFFFVTVPAVFLMMFMTISEFFASTPVTLKEKIGKSKFKTQVIFFYANIINENSAYYKALMFLMNLSTVKHPGDLTMEKGKNLVNGVSATKVIHKTRKSRLRLLDFSPDF